LAAAHWLAVLAEQPAVQGVTGQPARDVSAQKETAPLQQTMPQNSAAK